MAIRGVVFDAYGTLYDVQTVTAITDKKFPGFGDYITQVWRMKQLEYTWLRTMMGDYQDFWACTRDALSYTLKTLGQTADQRHLDEIAEAYNNLKPYSDAEEALRALSGYRRAILSNGSPAMLDPLVRRSGFDKYLEAWISVDSKRAFKPDPRAYEPVEKQMGLVPAEVLFVSSNGFDVSGAKRFGFKVARIERVTPSALNKEVRGSNVISPNTMFKATRMQLEEIGTPPDFVVASLQELSSVLQSLTEVVA